MSVFENRYYIYSAYKRYIETVSILVKLTSYLIYIRFYLKELKLQDKLCHHLQRPLYKRETIGRLCCDIMIRHTKQDGLKKPFL